LNKEELQNRIIAINKELADARTATMKLEGHLAEAHHWLATMFKAEMEALEPVPVNPDEPLKEIEDGRVDSQESCEAA
jgi:hypothetical protein